MLSIYYNTFQIATLINNYRKIILVRFLTLSIILIRFRTKSWQYNNIQDSYTNKRSIKRGINLPTIGFDAMASHEKEKDSAFSRTLFQRQEFENER